MIFPDISTEQWLARNPDLRVVEGRCNSCGKKMKTTKPFIEKDYLGLIAEDCDCGNATNTAITMITRSAQEHREWLKVLTYHL